MSRAKTIIGAMAVCALALAAFGGPTPSPPRRASQRWRAKKRKSRTGTYEDSHCLKDNVFKTSEYETTAITGSTPVTTVSANAPQLNAVIGLAKVVVECESSHGTGEVTNVVEEEEMRAHGTGIVVNYTGNCHARLSSHPEESCPIAGGSITTEPLTSITGPEMKVTFKPENEEEVFTEFTILHEGAGCTTLPEIAVEVTGQVSGEADEEIHSHVTFTEANNGSKLKANGGPAHYIGTEEGYMEGGETVTVGLETFE